jgi:hypothetical protein
VAEEPPATYRAPSVPEIVPEAPDAESIADELRERALSLTRWLDRASVVLALAVGVGVLLFLWREAPGQPAKLAYLIVSLVIVGAGRALARWHVKRRVAAWVARAERDHRVDGSEVWQRIWAGYY